MIYINKLREIVKNKNRIKNRRNLARASYSKSDSFEIFKKL